MSFGGLTKLVTIPTDVKPQTAFVFSFTSMQKLKVPRPNSELVSFLHSERMVCFKEAPRKNGHQPFKLPLWHRTTLQISFPLPKPHELSVHFSPPNSHHATLCVGLLKQSLLDTSSSMGLGSKWTQERTHNWRAGVAYGRLYLLDSRSQQQVTNMKRKGVRGRGEGTGLASRTIEQSLQMG